MNDYIVFEGMDGCGKTTLAKSFAGLYHVKKRPCVYTYEPNGEDEISSMLRKWTLSKDCNHLLNSTAREYLMMASRAIHMRKLDDLLKSYSVISDRSFISGMVYAHVASGWSFDRWLSIGESIITHFPTLVVFVTSKDQRIKSDGTASNDIYDSESTEFHRKIERTFVKVQSYLEHIFIANDAFWITFENDLSKTPEENSARLFKELSYCI